MSATQKRGRQIKNIRLADTPEHIDCRTGKATVALKTALMKKV